MRLFVYGTLLASSDTPAARWLRARMRSAQAASVPGRIVAIATGDGCYPALVRGAGSDRVRGAICDLALCPGDVARLDRYEGQEYRRVATRALIAATCRRVSVQVYRWRARLPRGSLRIPRGDFLAWLGTGRARAYESRTAASFTSRQASRAVWNVGDENRA